MGGPGASSMLPASGAGGGASAPASNVDAGGGAAGDGAGLDVDEQAWVFDPSALHTYELSLDPEVWAALQLAARDEEYAEADLVAAGQALGRVGLRFKGSSGTLTSCFADDGTPRCSKLSIKLKFDEYLPDQRFFGLKRLNFNSMLFDDSLLHERLAYRLYKEMGLVAPRSTHARLVVNGEDWGVFSLVEDVDGRFTHHHFDGGDGNLYKEAWPGNADDAVLAEALETNADVADNSGFLAFQQALLGASAGELLGVAERYLDVDATLAYLAIDQSISNWDGATAFYCYSADDCQNHNYYWYQHDGEPRFVLIPWDLDNTFEPSPLTGVPGLFEPQADCSLRFDAMGRTLRAPACDPLLSGLTSGGSARYAAQLDRLLAGPFAPGVIEGWVDELEAQLAPEVKTDTRGPDFATFEAAVARLRDAVGSLRERARAERL
ncbi:MAG TPA: CotH kinase family protein [Polyangiaceae bacterium]|nr:CotH kinase family protein [Polyangiaceae bacterium]